MTIPELPQYPNVDPFNYETMKKMLIEKLESFAAAPFTIQRISELLSDPRKQYSRIDKFMRAVEKTILVVSTVPPGRHRSESENGDSLDSALNGDFATEVNVDIEMEQDPSFAVTKEEPSVASPCKESTPKVSADSPETKTIKKSESPSKNEAGTSESLEVKSDAEESVKKPETESESASTVTKPKDIDSLGKETSPDAPGTATSEMKSENDESIAKTDETLIQPAAEVPATVASEPKLDDALLNEPIRSADNEILVDAAEIISETTPLAALENIVAIRDAAAAAADVLEPVELQAVVTAAVVAPEPETNENRDEVIVQTPVAAKDDSESETKRLKIMNIPESIPKASASAEPIAEVVAENIAQDEPLIPEIEEKSSQEEILKVTPSEPSIVEQQLIEVPPAETPEAVVAIAESITEEKVDEPLIEIAAIPIEFVPFVEHLDIIEASRAEMETTVPIAENKMSLDEDEPPAAVELEMTTIANKMDTDEAEANAPMDFEDDAEPMDQ